jgi:glucose/arabinose dehydrogenase
MDAVRGSRKSPSVPSASTHWLGSAAIAIAAIAVACGGSTAGPNGTAAPPRPASPTSSAASSPTGSAEPPATIASPSPGGSSAGASRFDPTGLHVSLEQVAGGFTAPLAVVNAHDGSNRLFVVEQGGTVRIVRNGTVAPTPFLDIHGEITSGGERGLLGLAFAPGFPTDPRVFVDYTNRNGDTQVSSFRVAAGDPDRVDPGSEQHVLFQGQPFPNHNGGALQFGPDHDLYISFGDGGSEGDPQGNGQKLTTFLSKILRIDVSQSSAGQPYRVPPDNPFASGANGAKPEIWLTGLRNPWRMSFDRATGDLWIGDVGQDSWEEADVQRAGVPGGTNFGWNRMEGSHCYRPPSGCEDPSLTLPVTDYGHDQGCTVIGGYVYRGMAQPALAGGYVFGDYCSGRVWAIDPSTNAYRTPTLVAETDHQFAAFGEDEAGELYAADIGAGTLLRVTASR